MGSAYGQVLKPASLEISPPFQFLNLKEGWKEPSGVKYEIPFQFENLDARSLVLDLEVCTGPQDSLYLYFEGIAWHAELELDDKFLGIHDDPFSPWIIPIESSWIDHKKAQLKLHLTKSKSFSNYPKPFLGIFRPVYLLNKQRLQKLSARLLPKNPTADTVAVLAPYYRDKGFIFDAFEAAKNINPILKAGIKTVYFPFEPGREMRSFCRELGLGELEVFDEEKVYGLINSYPYDRSKLAFMNRFWLDNDGNRRADYLVFVSGERSFFDKWSRISEKSLLLILLILFPIISLFLIKLANPGFFYGMQGLLVNPKLFISSFTDAAFSNQGLLYVLHLLSICNVAIWISLGILYMQSINYWDFLHVFREQSLLRLIFNEEDGLFLILGKSFSLLLIWFLFKQLLVGLLGSIFRIKGMRLEVMGLEIVADYPLILLMSTPFALFLFMDSFWGSTLLFVSLLVVLIFYLRTLYVMYVGLDRLFSFSYTVKFLYICSLNVIPYFILL